VSEKRFGTGYHPKLDLSQMTQEPAPLPKMLTDYDEHRHRLINNPSRNMMDRHFIAWDGEGITYAGSRQQAYVLLAASTGDFIRTPDIRGLTTENCLELLFRVEKQNRNAIHIGFSFGYDTNQILNSFTRREIVKLDSRVKLGRSYRWHGRTRFQISPGKSFQVTRGRPGDSDYANIRIYDTFHFFQTSFLNVVKKYAPDRLSEIEDGKATRGQFKYQDIEEITRYCLAENSLLVEIMEGLRRKFQSYGLKLRDWYGPGAIASASMKSHNIKSHHSEIPTNIKRISQYAYQGGRFELLRAGYHKGKVWQYDINSAYPSAIESLPSLRSGYWEHVSSFEKGVFGVWHISFESRNTRARDFFCDFRAQPFFFRDRRGGVIYPVAAENWYWQPEAELCETFKDWQKFEIIEGYIWRTNDDARPFNWVRDRYLQRLELKEKGDGDERVLKLELNSLYGKMAQRAGWHIKGDRIPTYHQLEWAGYITSATRAKVYQAYLLNPDAVFAFETDAIFSLAPLDLPLGKGLGEWSETIYSDILYLQNGFYFANGGEVAHYRGFDKGSLSFDQVLTWLDSLTTFSVNRKENERLPKLTGPTHRFIGYKRALVSKQYNYWRSWENDEREITIGRSGKRFHFYPTCPCCYRKIKWSEGLHYLQHSLDLYGERVVRGVIPKSYPHVVPWLDTELKGDYDDSGWHVDKEISLMDGGL